jgi:hypothetical protein
MAIHVGPHQCEFAVEALQDGQFAIICTTHPAHLELQTSSE